MKKFLIAVFIVSTLGATIAVANEGFLAILTMSGSKQTNVQGLVDGGVAGTPFSPRQLITVQPSVDTYVCVGQLDTAGVPNCNAINGVRVRRMLRSQPRALLRRTPDSLSRSRMVGLCTSTLRAASWKFFRWQMQALRRSGVVKGDEF